LAERSVQTFKNALKKWKSGSESIQTKVDRFLFAYRNTPHASTGLTPAELLMSRRPRTLLTLLNPRLQGPNEKYNQKQPRVFGVGDTVWARCYNGRNKWVKGVVVRVTGPLSYQVEVEGGIIRRHVDQMVKGNRQREEIEVDEERMNKFVDKASDVQVAEAAMQEAPGSEVTQVKQSSLEEVEGHGDVVAESVSPIPPVESVPPSPTVVEGVRTRSGRLSRKPDWYA